MKTIEAHGRINGTGRLVIDRYDKPAFINLISKERNKDVVVRVVVSGKVRSGEQNRYYHGVVVPLVQSALAEELGEVLTKGEVHEFLKQQCNWREHVNESTGESLRIAHTTTDLSTVEFEDYMERCRRFAAEFLNTVIPLPNEQLEIDITS